MVKRSVIDETGPFDTNFFMYIEDTDLCFRIIKLGYSVNFLDAGKIVHVGGVSSSTNDSRMLYEYCRSRLYFYSKWYSTFELLFLKIVICIEMLIRIFSLLFGPASKEMSRLQSRYKPSTATKDSSYSQVKVFPKSRSLSIYRRVFAMALKY